jgi:hypothetical protein
VGKNELKRGFYFAIPYQSQAIVSQPAVNSAPPIGVSTLNCCLETGNKVIAYIDPENNTIPEVSMNPAGLRVALLPMYIKGMA